MPGGRTFTFDEARGLVPRLRALTEEAIARLAEIPEDERGPEETGDAPTRAESAIAGVLGEWSTRIRELGAEVKGPWLVDFDSGAGYYCWRWPEESLEFFHSYEEGFASRVRIQ